MRHLNRLAALVFLAAVLVTYGAVLHSALGDESCQSAAELKAGFKANMARAGLGPARVVLHYAGAEAAAFIAAWNATPPATDEAGDEVLVMAPAPPWDRYVGIALFRDGCAILSGRTTLSFVEGVQARAGLSGEAPVAL